MYSRSFSDLPLLSVYFFSLILTKEFIFCLKHSQQPRLWFYRTSFKNAPQKEFTHHFTYLLSFWEFGFFILILGVCFLSHSYRTPFLVTFRKKTKALLLIDRGIGCYCYHLKYFLVRDKFISFPFFGRVCSRSVFTDAYSIIDDSLGFSSAGNFSYDALMM